MRSMTIFIDEEAWRAMDLHAERTGCNVEDMAANAVQNAAMRLPEYREVAPPPRIMNGPQVLCRMCGEVSNHVGGLCSFHRSLLS